MSVEVLDDVAVQSRDGVTVEQTKSVTAKGTNPIADRSVDLWKTLANWVDAAEAKHLDPATTSFEIFVSKRRSGPIAHAFADALNPEAVSRVLTIARDTLWGAAPRFAKRQRVSPALAPHVDRFFAAKNGVARPIVQRFSLAFGSGSSATDLLTALKSKIISPEMIETVGNQMLGWVQVKLNELIEQGRPGVIAAEEFNAELSSFVRKFDRFAILNSFASAPPEPHIDFELQNGVFVRQLDLIGADYDAKLKAANDFLRASVDRSIWATKGLVHASSFNEFEDQLTRTWDSKRQIAAIQAKGESYETIGRLLYSECSLFQCQLEGRTVPPHFTPGCYHELANKQVVGWHPAYKDILAPFSEKGDGT